jgi:hypothetical protein
MAPQQSITVIDPPAWERSTATTLSLNLLVAGGQLKDQMATREGGGSEKEPVKILPKNPAYVLLKTRSHTSNGSNHSPTAKTTRLWINL